MATGALVPDSHPNKPLFKFDLRCNCCTRKLGSVALFQQKVRKDDRRLSMLCRECGRLAKTAALKTRAEDAAAEAETPTATLEKRAQKAVARAEAAAVRAELHAEKAAERAATPAAKTSPVEAHSDKPGVEPAPEPAPPVPTPEPAPAPVPAPAPPPTPTPPSAPEPAEPAAPAAGDKPGKARP